MTAHDQTRATPETFRARALGISLTVKDLAKSLAWYTEVLGFTVANQRERDGKLVASALQAGDVRILLNQDDGAKGWTRVKGEGFSFTFTTVQDIDAIAARVKAAGHPLDTEPADMPWGARVFRVLDPDGYKLSISRPIGA
ncbi:MAG TPA: VOC family protein [Gemmatimonadales bacterium]|nr:VOC family protein [Gemmatimonadales bacterium]